MSSWGSKVGRVVLLACGLVFAAVLFLDLCDLIFDCGCRALWMGAAAQCNIHHTHPPHCPWCTAGLWGLVVPFGSIATAQAVVAFYPGRERWRLRLGLVLVAFPAVGGLVGLAFGLVSGYWG